MLLVSNKRKIAIGSPCGSMVAILVVLIVGWPLALSAAPAAAGEGRPDDVPVPPAPSPSPSPSGSTVTPPAPSPSPPGSTITPPVAGPGIYVELPVLDIPFVAANGGSFPSMEQSLWITAGLYQGLHLGLGKLVDPNAQSWQRRLLGTLLISAADVLTAPIPGFLGWQHEEWHRAVLSSHGIGSFDDIYRLQLFAEVTNVSHVRDDDLVRLKAQHPADQVRLSMAGIEANYVGAHALEKAAFFDDARSWNTFLYWLLYLQNYAYMSECSDKESDDVTARANAAEGANVSRRDFTGLDCDGWVYDLFRPDEPYSARGVHPSGVGIDRYRSYSQLAPEEQAYLRRQTKLSLLNFLDPNLLGIQRIRWPWSSAGAPVDFNLAVRHLPAAFGYDVRTDVFVRRGESWRALLRLHAGFNRVGLFPGVELEVLRMPVAAVAGAPLVIDARGSVWLQPEHLRYDSDRRIPGGLASVRASWGGVRTIEPYLEIEAKTGGWVAGDVYLDRNLSVRTGLILRLL